MRGLRKLETHCPQVQPLDRRAKSILVGIVKPFSLARHVIAALLYPFELIRARNCQICISFKHMPSSDSFQLHKNSPYGFVSFVVAPSSICGPKFCSMIQSTRAALELSPAM